MYPLKSTLQTAATVGVGEMDGKRVTLDKLAYDGTSL